MIYPPSYYTIRQFAIVFTSFMIFFLTNNQVVESFGLEHFSEVVIVILGKVTALFLLLWGYYDDLFKNQIKKYREEKE